MVTQGLRPWISRAFCNSVGEVDWCKFCLRIKFGSQVIKALRSLGWMCMRSISFKPAIHCDLLGSVWVWNGGRRKHWQIQICARKFTGPNLHFEIMHQLNYGTGYPKRMHHFASHILQSDNSGLLNHVRRIDWFKGFLVAYFIGEEKENSL